MSCVAGARSARRRGCFWRVFVPTQWMVGPHSAPPRLSRLRRCALVGGLGGRARHRPCNASARGTSRIFAAIGELAVEQWMVVSAYDLALNRAERPRNRKWHVAWSSSAQAMTMVRHGARSDQSFLPHDDKSLVDADCMRLRRGLHLPMHACMSTLPSAQSHPYMYQPILISIKREYNT